MTVVLPSRPQEQSSISSKGVSQDVRTKYAEIKKNLPMLV